MIAIKNLPHAPVGEDTAGLGQALDESEDEELEDIVEDFASQANMVRSL